MWWEEYARPRALAAIAGGLLLGVAGIAVVRRAWLEPRRQAAQKRFETMSDLATLYGLQLAHKRATGRYADRLEALLALSPDGAALKARMAGHLDLNTLTVVGDEWAFKIEANVLDADRTLMKIKGPVHDVSRPKAAAPLAERAPKIEVDAGAPIVSPRTR